MRLLVLNELTAPKQEVTKEKGISPVITKV